MRGDLDDLKVRVAALDARVVAAETGWLTVASRVAAWERRAAETPESAQEAAALAEDLRKLRDWMRAELSSVESRLADVRRRIDDATSAPPRGAGPAGPLTPEEEEGWATFARERDPGVRFSALVHLGQTRTDRAVQVAVERLADEDEEVLRQAIRNLGAFRERDAAPQVAERLDHPRPIIRAAARDALVAMGAPKEVLFDPIVAPDKRSDAVRAAAEALRRWADSQ